MFLFMAGLELQKNINQGTHNDGTAIHTGLYIDNIEFLAWHFKLSFRPYKNYRIWIATGRGVGNMVPRSPSFSLTLSAEW